MPYIHIGANESCPVGYDMSSDFLRSDVMILDAGDTMFGIGIPELIVIFIVALIFIGPKRLPDLARTLAKAVAEFWSAAEEVKENLDIEGMLAEEKEKLLRDYEEDEEEDVYRTGEDGELNGEESGEGNVIKTKTTQVEEKGGGNDLSG